ncbi:LamG-like jellyroll fold domain-containing protein [Frondihabitans peucedani]|uniref:LamG-like jellyroll fold domain-containing protein n=1 Tax=Frondihabitans peucedani TaxID=598626 RepID=UPI0031DFCD8C
MTTALTTTAVLAAGLVAIGGPAHADSAPADPTDPKTPVTVTTDVLPTPQIDGVVWTQAISKGHVFAGGEFTTARPFGAAAGVNTVSRANLLSYDITTGILDSAFTASTNAQVKAVAASSDGSSLFVAGSFTQVDGATRTRIAKVDAKTGALVSAFTATANSTVNALAVRGNTLYLGGAFTSVTATVGGAGVSRGQLAAVDATTGAILPWNPSAVGGNVSSLAVSPDGGKVVVGGAFTTLNGSGNPGYGLGAVDSTSGALLPWAANTTKVRDGGSMAGITSLTGDSTGVYGSGYVFGTGGTLEGTFRADWNGDLVWIADCHGDTYSTAVSSTALYATSHAHFCGDLQGFQQTNPNFTFHRATAFSKAATLTLTANPWGSTYTDFAGTPGPSLLNWNPTLTPGTYTGKTQAAWSVAANDDYVVYGGEFPTVDGIAQQGLVRFAVPSIAPNKDGPVVTGGQFVPNLTSVRSGSVKASWLANADRDNGTLSYALYRDGSSTPVYTTTAYSTTWLRPELAFTDTGLVPGSTHSYRLRATDPFGNTVLGNSVSITAASSQPSGYPGRVLADAPSDFWRLDETSGSAVRDFAGNNDLVAGAGVTRGAAGAVSDGDRASTFNGTTTGFAATQSPVAAPQTFTEEAWFSTTTTAGGKILGFGEQSTGVSTQYDRHLYLSTDGRLNFGVYNGSLVTLTSPAALNDGHWHQAVATLGSSGMNLYVDGRLIASRSSVSAQSIPVGYWRIGGDSTWNGSPWFAGSIDDVSIYPAALTAAQVQAHYASATGASTPPTNTAPTASFTQSASGLQATFDGSSSSDPDGSIASYSWSFGDGATATGATPTHAYAAAGSYSASLTVTDNGGATASTSRQVTVTVPATSGTVASDAFGRTLSSGWGTADVGGAWTSVGSASNLSMQTGTGRITLSGPSAQAGATLASVSQTGVDLSVTFALAQAASGGGTQVSLQGRKIGSSDYRATVQLTGSGTATVSLVGAGTTIANPVRVAGSIGAGTRISTRLQVVGTSPTTLRAKAWIAGTTEPSAWMVTATSSAAALQAPGSLGLLSYVSGSSAAGAQSLSVDDLVATTP